MSTFVANKIEKDQWVSFFNDLGKQYQGWAVTIEVLNREFGDQRRVEQLPLQGVSYEPAGSQAGDILIETGDAGMPYETHLIRRPRVVQYAMTQPGAEVDLDIESEEGYTTLVRIRRRPQLPPPRA